MTLLELLVGLAIFAIVSLAVAAVLTLGLNLSGFFFRNAATMEAVSDGMFQLSAIMPQVVKVNSCNCSGTGSSVGDCTWSTAGEWLDPVFDGGMASGSKIFEGEFEAGNGGSGEMSDTTLTSAFSLARGCGPTPTVGPPPYPYNDASNRRGCRQMVRLTYTTPTMENPGTGVRSEPGFLEISIHNIAAPAQKTTFRIGNEGGIGATRSGLVRMSCGFASPGAGQVGTNFVINLRTKVKQQVTERPAASEYESWHPGGKNYSMGFFREARMKFNLQNLSVRGAYHWRLQSLRGCKLGGDTLGSGQSSDVCCSGASDGTSCLDFCRRAGVGVAEDSECCSGKKNGVVCE
ncbi:MAG: prepilin-type N-terminal cleavage/methylation domain-containing protein [Bdellovibrionales bacterium]|nr:prepilin-type N-terminal cleavage/methylation domain-containing protein [Bdellovibrionales bacterium]